MDLRLSGKRALVTGAAGLIGSAVARTLVEEGVTVGLAGRSRTALNEVASALPHGSVEVVVMDTTEDASVRAGVAELARRWGGIDILVNGVARAAGSPSPPLGELTDDALREEFETKVLGYLRTSRAVVPVMVAGGWGRIINIAGLNARLSGSIAGSIRNVSVAAMTKALADEVAGTGVNVTVVHPGRTVSDAVAWTTPQSTSSIGRAVAASEVADVVTFLASPRSVAINGDAVAAGGGWMGSIHY